MEARRLVAVEEVPDDGTLAVTLGRDGTTREILLTRLDDGEVVAWENHCLHWIDVRLDKGEGALLRGDEIVCQRHGAMFDRATGVCTWRPCAGAKLDAVAIDQADGVVFLDEPGWTVVGRCVGQADGNVSRGGLDL